MPASIHQNSSDFDTISTANLSPAQVQVAAALARGRCVTAAAVEAGLHRSTIHKWLRHEPAFKTAVQQARAEYAVTLNDGMRDLAALALETLHNLLADRETPPAIRLKAALAVLQRLAFPKPRLAFTRAHPDAARAAGYRQLSGNGSRRPRNANG